MAKPGAKVLTAFLIAASCSLPAAAQRGPGAALFARYPFDRWAAENAHPGIKWETRIDPPRLSPQQRLVAQLKVTVEGDEVRKHDSAGQIAVLMRIEDAEGHRYQTGNQTSIARLRQGPAIAAVNFSVSAFMLPGDYTVSFAVCDSRTLQHSFVSRRFHVPKLNPDALPGTWDGLPAVEFVPELGIPEAWYLPQLRSRMTIPLAAERPVRLDLLVNTTPSELGSLGAFRHNMAIVVPSLRVLLGIQPGSGSLGVSIVDMNRQKVTWEQTNVVRPDWFGMRRVFTEFSAAKVDAHDLAGQRKMLDYFAGEASRLVATQSPEDTMPHALIVLSAPVVFSHQEVAALPDFPIDPRHRIFYICYSPIGVFQPDIFAPGEGPSFHLPLYGFADDIERLLKPKGARVFRVARPEEFRKALGTILAEIAKM